MRSERALVTVLLAIPLVVIFVGWATFAKWTAEPVPHQATPTSAREAQASRPAPRPTDGAPATVVARPVSTRPAQTAAPISERMAEPRRGTAAEATQAQQGSTGGPAAPTTAPVVRSVAEQIDPSTDPTATVASFYRLVAEGRYEVAAELWSPQMKASYPPSENIVQRFSQTQSMTVQRADLISQDPRTGRAAVAVEVIESRPDGAHRWAGIWYLVHGPSGWLLDQPLLSGE